MRGYKDKYLTIGQTLHQKYGYTVVCASNPLTMKSSLTQGIKVIEKYVSEPYQIYYIGHSNGALQVARNAYLFPQIKRMLLINGPLMINIHKTREGLAHFKADSDPTFFYVEGPILSLSHKIKKATFR